MIGLIIINNKVGILNLDILFCQRAIYVLNLQPIKTKNVHLDESETHLLVE